MAPAIPGDSSDPASPGAGANDLAAPGTRLHWIDWLRVAAIAGVFLYHTLRPFNTDAWHVKNAETSAVLNSFTTFFSSFGLALLFLLAGAGVRFALRKRTWRTFLRERTTRLLIPFAVGTLLLSPVQGLIEATSKGTTPNPASDLVGWWSVVISWAAGRGVSPSVFGIGYHLWFLGFLFAISVVALPLCAALSSGRADRWVGGLARALNRRGSSLLVVVPIYAVMGIGAALGTGEHDWFEFCWYLGYFLIGFVLVLDGRFIEAVRRDAWPAALLAGVSTTFAFAGIPAPFETFTAQGFGPTSLAMGAVFAAEGWAWTLLILNLGLRLRHLQRPLSEHLGDAVLPIYVVHQPVILAVAFFVVQWPIGILPKWLVVLGLAAPLTVGLVELALRSRIARRLLGVRVRSIPPVTGTAVRVRARVGRPVPPARGHHAGPG